MSEPMQQALTAEEWAEYAALAAGSGGWPSLLDAALLKHAGLAGLTDHKVAALALHGQPFGFTWGMVRALEDVIAMSDVAATDRCTSRAERAECEANRDLAREAMDRIAAILPPEEK